MYDFQPPMQQFAPQRSAPIQQPMRSAGQQRVSRNDVYLPAMPEMLRPPPAHGAEPPPRYAQGNPKNGNLVIRGQAPDEPALSTEARIPPIKLTLPPPEQLGLMSATVAKEPALPMDWPTARDRLEQWGASYYRLEKGQGGTHRFVCAFPNGAKERHFEVNAASETEAISLVMQQVGEWRMNGK